MESSTGGRLDLASLLLPEDESTAVWGHSQSHFAWYLCREGPSAQVQVYKVGGWRSSTGPPSWLADRLEREGQVPRWHTLTPEQQQRARAAVEDDVFLTSRAERNTVQKRHEVMAENYQFNEAVRGPGGKVLVLDLWARPKKEGSRNMMFCTLYRLANCPDNIQRAVKDKQDGKTGHASEEALQALAYQKHRDEWAGRRE